MIKIEIQKKDLYLLTAIMIFLLGAGYVIAYNSVVSPSIMGHSFEELELPSCSDGQILKYSGGAWSCGADNSGESSSVSGTVTGGGVCGSGGGGNWGTGSCYGEYPECSSGNTARVTGIYSPSYAEYSTYFICIRN